MNIMQRIIICGLLASLVLLTGSKAQEPGSSSPRWYGESIPLQFQGAVKSPTLTAGEEAVVSMYAAEWMELRQIVSHLQGVQELVQAQMDWFELGLLEERDLDPQKWRLDWETATIKARDRGI